MGISTKDGLWIMSRDPASLMSDFLLGQESFPIKTASMVANIF